MKTYDIFISYRREGGYETAQLISQYLKYKGYNVFFDLENLREPGKFNLLDKNSGSGDVAIQGIIQIFGKKNRLNKGANLTPEFP